MALHGLLWLPVGVAVSLGAAAATPGRSALLAGLRTGVALVAIMAVRVFLISPYVSVSYVVSAPPPACCWASVQPVDVPNLLSLALPGSPGHRRDDGGRLRLSAEGTGSRADVYHGWNYAANPPRPASLAAAHKGGDAGPQIALQLAAANYRRLTGVDVFSAPQNVAVLPAFATIELPEMPAAEAIRSIPACDTPAAIFGSGCRCTRRHLL